MLDKLSQNQKIIMGLSILVLIYAIIIKPILEHKKNPPVQTHNIHHTES